MTIAELAVFGTALLYLLTIAPVKAIGYRDFDNANPRDPGFFKPGIRARALGAHINGIEGFPFFAAAVLLAEYRNQPQHLIDLLAGAFLLLRLGFVAAYVSNRSTTRTLLWNLGFFVNAAIFLCHGGRASLPTREILRPEGGRCAPWARRVSRLCL